MSYRKFVQIRIKSPQYKQNEIFSKSIDKVILLNRIAKYHNELGSWLEKIDSQHQKGELALFEYDARWRALYSKRAFLHEKYCQVLRDYYPDISLEILKLRENTGGFLTKLDTMS